MTKVSRAGGTIALGVAFLLGAAGFGSTALFVPGVALAFLGLGSVLWVELSTRTARLVRVPGPSKLVEREPYPLHVQMERGWMRPPGARLHDPVLEREIEFGPLWTGTFELDVKLERRGRRRLAPARLTVRDPLGLHSRELHSEASGEVLVLPRIEPVEVVGDRGAGGRGLGALGVLDGDGAGGRPDAPGVEFEIDGLRPYREGTPASRIHWPAVARSGELMERRLVAGAGSARLIVLDAANPADEADLDSAVRAATSLCVHLARAGGCTLLLPGEGRPISIDRRLAGWPAAHTRLALVEARDGSPTLGRIARAASVFWVTAAESRKPPRALLRFGSSNSYLVTPRPVPGLQSEFTVAGCAGRRVTKSRRRSAMPEAVAA